MGFALGIGELSTFSLDLLFCYVWLSYFQSTEDLVKCLDINRFGSISGGKLKFIKI